MCDHLCRELEGTWVNNLCVYSEYLNEICIRVDYDRERGVWKIDEDEYSVFFSLIQDNKLTRLLAHSTIEFILLKISKYFLSIREKLDFLQ